MGGRAPNFNNKWSRNLKPKMQVSCGMGMKPWPILTLNPKPGEKPQTPRASVFSDVASETLNCPEPCQNTLAATLNPKPQTG